MFMKIFLPSSTFFSYLLLFFLNDTAPTEIYPLSLHDALPIWLFPASRLRARRPITIEPSFMASGTLATLVTMPSAACSGWRFTRSRRRTSVARWSSADSSTSSRRRRRISSSVTGGSQSPAQGLFVALQDRDGVLEERRAALRRGHDVSHARAPRDDEDPRERREDRGPVVFRGPHHEGEDRQQQTERQEVERGHGDHEESHRPGLLLLQLDRDELQARTHGAQPRRGESLDVADDAGCLANRGHGVSGERRGSRSRRPARR